MKPYLPLVLSVFIGFVGCTQLSRDDAKTPAVYEARANYQRFLPIAPTGGGSTPLVGVPWHGFFALDTKTGVLCRTTNRKFKDDWANDLPLCFNELTWPFPEKPDSNH